MTTYAETLERAQDVESSLRRNESTLDEPKGKRKWNDNMNKRRGFSKKVSMGEGSNPKPQQRKPLCHSCGKNHNGDCMKGKNVCYRCWQPGHMAFNCPVGKGTKVATPGKPPARNARAFALDRHDAANDSGNIAGMISISDMPVLTLFDTGASHSFISATLCSKLKLTKEKLSDALEVSIPLGRILIADEICKSIDLDLGCRSLIRLISCIGYVMKSHLFIGSNTIFKPGV